MIEVAIDTKLVEKVVPGICIRELCFCRNEDSTIFMSRTRFSYVTSEAMGHVLVIHCFYTISLRTYTNITSVGPSFSCRFQFLACIHS